MQAEGKFLKYVPAVPGDWTVPPTTVGPALDELAANITGVVTDPAGPIYDGPSGLNIYLGTGLEVVSDDGGIDADTSLMLHGDNTLADASSYANTPVETGTVGYVAGEFSNAMDFDGTNRVNFSSLLAGGIFDIAGGDFTIDFWINTTTTGKHVVGRWLVAGGDWYTYILSTTVLRLGVPALGLTVDLGGSGINFCDGSWHHIAIVRDGNNFISFTDGVQNGTTVMAGTIPFTSTTDFAVGGISDSLTDAMIGAVDELRFSKGIARWTTSFTPPVAPYTVTVQNLTSTDVTGTATLVASNVSVAFPSITAAHRVFVTVLGTPVVATYGVTITPGVGFDIDSTGVLDTSTLQYLIIVP